LETATWEVAVEIRAVNNRFLKVNLNQELSAGLQTLVEEEVRRAVSRGTVNVRVRLVPRSGAGMYRINREVLQSYRQQLEPLVDPSEISWDVLLSLPGVTESNTWSQNDEEAWLALQPAVALALEHFEQMRRSEGEAMAANLTENLNYLEVCTGHIERLAPRIVEHFTTRLTDRLNHLLEKYDVRVQPQDVVREVGIFAERADIAEELVRLRSHVELFRQTMRTATSNGRKLDFVVQEMLRETNTIGSKCGDAEVAGWVVEMKTTIERMREMVQNVE
jgi:uncharacterized protein (TIGR00255 family)